MRASLSSEVWLRRIPQFITAYIYRLANEALNRDSRFREATEDPPKITHSRPLSN
jgi:hypothetical protein